MSPLLQLWRRHSLHLFRASAALARIPRAVGRSSSLPKGFVASSACVASAGLLLSQATSRCEDSREASLAGLTSEDVAKLKIAIDTGIERLLEWADCPDSFWDQNKVIHLRGVGQALHKAKRLAGFDTQLHLVVADWDSVSLEELQLVSSVSEDCLKLKFDPVLESFNIHSLEAGKLRLVRTNTRPALLGIVGPREVDSVLGGWRRLADKRIISAAVGLQSPFLKQHIQGSPRLEALSQAPPSAGKIRAMDHTSGYILAPLDKAAESGERGRWKVTYILLSEAGGGLPTWAAEKGVSKAILDWFTEAARALDAERKTPAAR